MKYEKYYIFICVCLFVLIDGIDELSLIHCKKLTIGYI